MEIKEAIEIICKELRTDKGYYDSWQANIAMAFFDEYRKQADACPTILDTGTLDFHQISNDAAHNFLKLLTMKREDCMTVAEKLYYYKNPDTKMNVPNTAYIQTEKWYKEWQNEETDLDLYEWVLKNKQ